MNTSCDIACYANKLLPVITFLLGILVNRFLFTKKEKFDVDNTTQPPPSRRWRDVDLG